MALKTITGKSLARALKKYKDACSGVLTNQSAFGYRGMYHFEYYRQCLGLKYMFVPEHGLFAELQDQEAGDGLTYFYSDIEVVSLYGSQEGSLVPDKNILKKLEVVLIDIRDVGVRYFTYLTTCFYFMREVAQHNPSIPIFIIDSPNPTGRKVEGSPLQPEFQSFLGLPGTLHRYGLTPAELLVYYMEKFGITLNVTVVLHGEIHPSKVSEETWVPPSPNLPTLRTCWVYPGQCLLEGTNLSEGRGTTKPFEIFGAPYIDINDPTLLARVHALEDGSFSLRPLRFIPVFHKHIQVPCGGFQLFVRDVKAFHSLFFTLRMIRLIREHYPQAFTFLPGPYEFGSDKSAIELLVGDTFLLSYLNGQHTDAHVQQYLGEQERAWGKRAKDLRFY